MAISTKTAIRLLERELNNLKHKLVITNNSDKFVEVKAAMLELHTSWQTLLRSIRVRSDKTIVTMAAIQLASRAIKIVTDFGAEEKGNKLDLLDNTDETYKDELVLELIAAQKRDRLRADRIKAKKNRQSRGSKEE